MSRALSIVGNKVVQNRLNDRDAGLLVMWVHATLMKDCVSLLCPFGCNNSDMQHGGLDRSLPKTRIVKQGDVSPDTSSPKFSRCTAHTVIVRAHMH